MIKLMANELSDFMMKVLFFVFPAVFLSLLLAACDDHRGMKCARDHTELMAYPLVIGNITTIQWMPYDVCDEWVKQ